MAILCLFLGLLCVVGFGSSQDPPTTVPPTVITNPPITAVATTKSSTDPNKLTTVVATNKPTNDVAATNKPTTVAATTQPVAATQQPTTVAGNNQPNTAATKQPTAVAATAAPVAATTASANTNPNVLTTVPATPQSRTTKTPSSGEPIGPPASGAPTGPASGVTTAQGTKLPGVTSPVPKVAVAPVTGKPTTPSMVTTKGDLRTSLPAASKGPEGTGTKESPQINPATNVNSTSTPGTSEIPPKSYDFELPKESDRSTPALGSSASPSQRITPTTIAGAIPDVTTKKSVIPLPPGDSSSVPESTTHKDPQRTSELDEAKTLQEKNIEVNCANVTNENSKPYVKLALGGATICDTGVPTEGGRTTGEFNTMLMHVCKAIKPGYQEKQDKCVVRVARIEDNYVAITDAFIESHLQPKELFTQMKRNGANLTMLSFDNAEEDDVDVVSIPLIGAIVGLAMLLLIIAAGYGCWHQRKTRKREQRLTEELQTMENGYHDNPTLEVMETSPEMQEKKGGPNGELGDSWIVPLDNLTREDLEEEEDTHL